MIRSRVHRTRVGKRNQVTIPAAMLRELGVEPGSQVEIALDGGEIHVQPARDPVAQAFGILKRRGDVPMTDDEIRAAADEGRRLRWKQASRSDG